MNIGQLWQVHYIGPTVNSTRLWIQENLWPWLKQEFRFGKWPSKGFYLVFRYWRMGLLELRRYEQSREEREKEAVMGEQEFAAWQKAKREEEEKGYKRLALVIVTVLLTVVAIMVVVAAGQEKPAPSKEPIAISQDEAKVIQIRREAWEERNQRVAAARAEYERAVEGRAEARIELVGEVERLRVKYKVPNGWVLDFEGMKWQPPQANSPR